MGVFGTNRQKSRALRVFCLKRLPLLAVMALGFASFVACNHTSPAASSGAPPVLTMISVSPPMPSISVGASEPFAATGTFSDGSTQALTDSVAWSSSNAADATIQTAGQAEPGMAVGVAAGSVTITASMSGKSGTAMLTITSSAPTLTSISVTPPSPSISVGATQPFTATGTYSDGSTKNLTNSVTWASSNAADATIQTGGQAQPGLATGVAPGSVTITAAMSGKSGTAMLMITSASSSLTAISVTPPTPSVAIGATQQFTATGTYSNGTVQVITSSVTWASSNTADATIQTAGRASPGLATGVAGGTVTITASMKGIRGTASLTVTTSGATIVSIAVDPLNPSIAVGATQQFFATATFSDGSTQDITTSAAWASSNSDDATIQTAGQAQPGLASGVAAGNVTITASSSGKSGNTSLSVTAAAGNGTKIPLMDMASSQNYLNSQGGLYENSSDTVPADHAADGQAIAATIQPLDTNGNPSSSGKIAFVSVGMSNAADEFGLFISDAASDTAVNHTTLVIANGAAGSQVAPCWTAATGPAPCGTGVENEYDRVRDTVLTPLGLTEQQVQVIWLKEADSTPGVGGCGTNGDSPCRSLCDTTIAGCSNTVTGTEAVRYESEVGEILRAAKTRWPNLKLAFLSTRIYAGYATTDLNPEPYAYEYGFSAKWLIEAQITQIRTGTVDPIAGDLDYNDGTAPWTAWSAYIWANGDIPRSDGLVWCDGQAGSPCDGEVDFQSDGTHPDVVGGQKVANMLLNFFLGSPYTASWFAAP
jgi:uncharacterized protein YjdB